MKDILIIANFCGNIGENNNNRFVYISNELSQTNQVELVTSDFSHEKKMHREQLTIQHPFKITLLHELGYKKNISIKRFFSHYTWGVQVIKYLRDRATPDVVYCAVPSLAAAWFTSKYCKRHKIRFIIDIQDLWPEAFKMVFRIPLISDFIFAPFSYIANRIYKNADDIIAVSDTYVQRALAVNKKCDCGHTVYIGTRLETYDKATTDIPLYRKSQNEIWIGYCGSLATSYDIPNLIYASKYLKVNGFSNVKLIIMGDGGCRQLFEGIAEEQGVDSIFTGRLPYHQMCAQLNECDIVVNPIKRGSAATIINKHADYAASGLPVVNSQDSLEYRQLIAQYGMGINCENENAVDMAEKLEKLIRNVALRDEMGRKARRCAEDKFDRKNSYTEIFELIVK